MAITQAESFASVLEKSDVLPSEQVATAKSLLAGIKDSKTAAKKLIEKGLLTRWQASQLLAGKTDLRLGKYVLIDRLGKGGMGSVYLAEHKTMRRRVAIKTLPHDATEKTAAAERLREEARAISSLDHRNIIHAYDTELRGDRPYLVLEYVAGQDLEKVVRATGRLDFRRAADYIAQAAEGLAHAHSRHLLHRDIKPANLLVDAHGTVKILDLGLASMKHPEAEAHGAAGDNVLGTVDFLPPEQALGGDSLDQRSDIYSLGCTLYFLLTAQPPFPDGSLAEKLVKHQIEEPRSLLKLRPKTPHELVKICRKMMAKKPDERFANCDEVAAGLRKWLVEAGSDVPDDSNDPLTSSGAMPVVKNGAASVPPAKIRPPVLAPRGVSDSGSFADLGLEKGSGRMKTVAPSANRPVPETAGATGMSRQNKIILFSALGVGGFAAIGIVVALLTGSSDKTDKEKLNQDTVSQVDPTKKTDATPGKNSPTPPAPKRDATPGKTPPAGQKGSSTNSSSDQPLPDKFEKPDDKTKPEDQPKSDENPKPEDKPKGRSKTKSKPQEAPPEPKTEKPKDSPPEPKPEPPADPFRDLPPLAELPALGGDVAAAPLNIGKVALKDRKLEMSFATPSGKNAPKFLVQPGLDPAAQNEWRVVIEGAEAEPVATISLRGDELSFQWAAGAKPPADQLRNGLLKLKSGDKDRVFALRKCLDTPQIAVDLSHPANAPRMFVNIDVDALPSEDNLWLQILKPEATDLKFEVQPSDLISLKTPAKLKDAPTVAFGMADNKKAPKAMGLSVQCMVHGKSRVRVEVVPQVLSNGQWVPLSPPALTARYATLNNQKANAPAQLHAMQTAKVIDAPAIENFKSVIMPGIDKDLKLMDELQTLISTVRAKAKLNYRLYTKVDDREIELARSGGAVSTDTDRAIA